MIYARDGDGYLVDDRNHGRLTIAATDLATARERIPSYQHRLVIADPAATELDPETMEQAIRESLSEQVEHLSSSSQSFSLPAFSKWAKMLTSTTNAKGWPRVFDDGGGLLEALVSTYEAIDDVGILGGNLRNLYADFLSMASEIVGKDLSVATEKYRDAEAAWSRVAIVCVRVPEVSRVVELDRARRRHVDNGDSGRDAASNAALEIREIIEESSIDLDEGERVDLFAELADRIEETVAKERDALDSLRTVLTS